MYNQKTPLALAILSTFGTSAMLLSGSVFAETDSANETTAKIEKIAITGTRATPRTVSDSAVPVDVFNAEDLDVQAFGDMTDTLKVLVPSFSATPLTGDGSAFVRPTSLRGLPPDETLVLINSKRRHRSSLIAHFGAAMNSGSQAVDIGMIPSIALKNVEVLRDGAAAQYGSDAIAGVMNFIMRDDDEGGELQVQAGQFYEGEDSYKIAGNIGFALTDNGFLNLSAEYTDNDKLVRGFQHAAAIGVPGARNPAMNWGRPESHGLRTVFNAGYELNQDMELYTFGNYADTYGNYGFFYRAPNRSGVLTPVPVNPQDPSQGNFSWGDTYPAGFTPFLEGDQKDFSQIAGIKGAFGDDISFDISANYGSNKLEYTLNDTINPSWGPDSPSVFHPGDLKQTEKSVNADFSLPLTDDVVFSFGAEWRQEKYTMYEGDAASWQPGPWAEVSTLIDPVTGENYATPGNSANGMPGTDADAAGNFKRRNTSIYTDLEWDVSDDWFIQAAVRAEDFSDFGSTVNFKLATRYHINDEVTFRAAASTGFRAPTPGQSNYTGIVSTFDGVTGQQTFQGTVKPTDPLALALGGTELDAEDSVNFSIGFSAELTDELNVTVDAYQIDVDDRITKTQFLPVSGNPNFSNLSFYTNALNTKTSGLDIVATYSMDWRGGGASKLSLGYNYNNTEVKSQNQVGGLNPVSDSTIRNIEKNLPDHHLSGTIIHNVGDFTITARANYYSETLDERGSAEKVGAEVIVDFSVAYHMNDSLTWTLGANNLFDEYPDKIDTRVSQGMPYPRRSPIGYDGGFVYLKLGYQF